MRSPVGDILRFIFSGGLCVLAPNEPAVGLVFNSPLLLIVHLDSLGLFGEVLAVEEVGEY